MENAADALLMAFAVLVFVIALTLAFSSLAQAKSTADIILFFNDRTNFQELVQPDNENYKNGAREVGIDTVIATIERCIKEKFTVYIYDNNNYTFEYDTSNEEEIKIEITKFLDNHKNDTSSKYLETFVEVATSGKTYQGADGTKVEEDVGKKIYITYTKSN